MKSGIKLLFILLLLSSCRTNMDEILNCVAKRASVGRSRDHFIITRTKCYYFDKKLKSKQLHFFRSSLGYKLYVDKRKCYSQKGRLEEKVIFKRNKIDTVKYYTNGKLKSSLKISILKSVRFKVVKILPDSSTVEFYTVESRHRISVDSLTGKKIKSKTIDTIFTNNNKFKSRKNWNKFRGF